MKILIATGIYPPDIGGPATFVREFASSCVAHGDVVKVVTYGDATTETSDVFSVHVIPRSGGALLRYVRYAWKVFSLARSCDVVFAQGPVSEGLPATVGAMFAGKLLVMKVVGDYAWEQSEQKDVPSEFLDDFVTHEHAGLIGKLERIERWTSRQARRVIVPSEYLKRIVSVWGVAPEKISVIYNSLPPLPATRPRDVLRSEFGLGDRRVILTAVRAVPWKGVDVLIKALASIDLSAVLVVAGDGPSLDEWKQLAQTKGVADRVRFVGRLERSQLAEWYAAADVFALASSYEGFPHVIVEAVSVGLPCLVTDRGGNPETKKLFPDQVEIVPFGDVAAWSRALATPRPHFAPRAVRPFADVADEVRAILSNV